MKLLLVLLMLLFLVNVDGISFLPTEFVPESPLNYTADQSIALKINLCNVNLYSSCLFTAKVDSPFELWSIRNGLYVKFSIIGGQNCNKVYCSNNIESPENKNCSFYLPPNTDSAVLYFVSQSGQGTSLPSTFNLQIDCKQKGNSSVSNYTQGCPIDYQYTKKNIKISFPQSVKTSPYYPKTFQFVACPSTTGSTNFNFVLVATDLKSAFSTYICENVPANQCGAGIATPGWYDASGSGINIVSQDRIPAGVLTAAVYGWGDFNSSNNFIFNVAIADRS